MSSATRAAATASTSAGRDSAANPNAVTAVERARYNALQLARAHHCVDTDPTVVVHTATHFYNFLTAPSA